MSDVAWRDRVVGDDLDPQLLAAIEDLELIARSVVEGFQHGLHRSPYVGFSVEFASHREYLAGDDLRHINWKVFARQDRLYIKQYDAETNLDLHLVVDVSGSMRAANSGISKQHYAAILAASLAHLALRQRDSVGLTLFADRVLSHTKPRSNPDHLFELLVPLADKRNHKHASADSPSALHAVAELIPRRGLVVLLSDLFYDPEPLIECWDHFKHSGHELLVMQILDPVEQHLAVDGSVRLVDLETGEYLVTQSEDLRSRYEEAIAEWLCGIRRQCEGRNIGFETFNTRDTLDRALTRYLASRSELY
jgi:uncharacterized protein (DUF58 family)